MNSILTECGILDKSDIPLLKFLIKQLEKEGYFVVFEGADNLGKTTVAKIVCERLGFKYMKFPNPDLYSGQILRKILQKKLPFEPASFQALNIVDRIFTSMSGNVIIDRYIDSGKVYGESDGLPSEWVDQLNSILLQPDLVFVFTGEPFTTDNEHYDNSEKVVAGYRKLLEDHKCDPRYVEIRANRAIEEVVDEIIKIINERTAVIAGLE